MRLLLWHHTAAAQWYEKLYLVRKSNKSYLFPMWRQPFGASNHNILDLSAHEISYKYDVRQHLLMSVCQTINNSVKRKNSRHLMVPCTLVPDSRVFFMQIKKKHSTSLTKSFGTSNWLKADRSGVRWLASLTYFSSKIYLWLNTFQLIIISSLMHFSKFYFSNLSYNHRQKCF